MSHRECIYFDKYIWQKIWQFARPEKTRRSLKIAAKTGNFEAIRFGNLDWDDVALAVDEACLRGQLKILKYFHSLGKYGTSWAIHGACLNGNLNIIRYLHDRAQQPMNLVGQMNYACISGNLDLVKYLCKKVQETGATGSVRAIEYACASGNADVVKYLHTQTDFVADDHLVSHLKARDYLAAIKVEQSMHGILAAPSYYPIRKRQF